MTESVIRQCQCRMDSIVQTRSSPSPADYPAKTDNGGVCVLYLGKIRQESFTFF